MLSLIYFYRSSIPSNIEISPLNEGDGNDFTPLPTTESESGTIFRQNKAIRLLPRYLLLNENSNLCFFNISGLIMAIYGLFFVIGKISTFDSVSEEVNKIEKDANAIVLKIENFKNEHATRFSRERSKNQILEEDKSDAERNFLKQNNSLEKMKVDIQEYEKTCEITLEKITEAKIDKVSKSKEFEKLNDDFLNANRIIPEIEVSKNNTQSKIEALEFEIKDLNLRKKNYENQTQILKMHHESVLDSLLADKNSRNWLEEGEQITVFLMSINLKNVF